MSFWRNYYHLVWATKNREPLIQPQFKHQSLHFTELSHRELEVLRLIAAGSSNAEIAEKLVISEKTVKGHVSNIISKLHLADRTQAAVYAWREGRDP